MKKLIYIALLILLFGCKKEPISENIKINENINSNFELIWSHPINNLFVNPQYVNIVQNSVIYTSENSSNTLLTGLNKISGDSLWSIQVSGYCTQTIANSSQLLASINGELISINGLTGAINWTVSHGYLNHFITENGKIYALFNTSSVGIGDIKLYTIDISSGTSQLETTISLSQRGCSKQFVDAMNYWQHPNGNEMIVVQSTETIGLGNEQNNYVYDFSNDSLYFNLFGVHGVKNPLTEHIIKNDIIYINQGAGESKINLVAKTFICQKPTSGLSPRKSMLMYNGKLYLSVSDNNGVIVKNVSDLTLNKRIAYYDSNLGNEKSSGKNFHINNDKLYSLTGTVFSIFNLNSCELKYSLNRNQELEEMCNYPIDSYDDSFVVDSQTNNIYLSWRGVIVCMQEK